MPFSFLVYRGKGIIVKISDWRGGVGVESIIMRVHLEMWGSLLMFGLLRMLI